MNTNTKNKETLFRIADELELYASGNYTKIDGELALITPDGPDADAEAVTIYDYIDDNAIDWDYIVSRNGSYKGVRIMITCGGPNIYVNTFSRKIELYWWSEEETCPLESNVIDAIDEYFEDYFNNCY